MTNTFTIGIDFGTSSARAIVVDCRDGRVVSTGVFDYPSGEQGVLLHARDPHLARQNPADYLQGLAESVGRALEDADCDDGFAREQVIGLGREIGFDAIDSGPLSSSRHLEALGYLNIVLGYVQKLGPEIGFRLVR